MISLWLIDMGKIIDLTGQRFGRLVVVRDVGRASNCVLWECRCDCGTITKVLSYQLIRGRVKGGTKSCGCLQREIASGLFTKHGKINTQAYRAWHKMKGRCLNPNNKDWPAYGGRGIGIFEPWIINFSPFYEHMGDPPGKGYSLGRIDNDKGYFPGNVQWEDSKQQANNKRNNVVLEFRGVKKTLTQWSEELGIPRTTLRKRIFELGWSVEKAFTTPVRKQRKPDQEAI